MRFHAVAPGSSTSSNDLNGDSARGEEGGGEREREREREKEKERRGGVRSDPRT